MNPIYHIRLNKDDDRPSTLVVDLSALLSVGRPRPYEQPWSASFTLSLAGASKGYRPEFTDWDLMVEQRNKLLEAWEAYRNQPPVTPVVAKDRYTTITDYTGVYERPVCLTGIRNMNIIEGNEAEPTCELYISYADGKSEDYAFASVKLLQHAVNTINLALIRE